MLLSPHEETERLWQRTGRRFATIIEALAATTAARDPEGHAQAMEQARVLFGQTLAWLDLMGRRRIALLARAARSRASREDRSKFAVSFEGEDGEPTWEDPTVPHVVFAAAVDDLLARTPEIAPGYLAVREAYSQRHAFALARSLDLHTTKRVRTAIADAMARGSSDDPAEVVAEIGAWSRAYGETVWRTNMVTAYTAGVWGEMERSEVMVGARYVALHDKATRPNHAACDGLIAPKNSALWDTYSPPAGFNCRCGLEEVSIYDAERENLLDRSGNLMTLLPAGFGVSARPDPGFGGGRPDRRLLRG